MCKYWTLVTALADLYAVTYHLAKFLMIFTNNEYHYIEHECHYNIYIAAMNIIQTGHFICLVSRCDHRYRKRYIYGVTATCELHFCSVFRIFNVSLRQFLSYSRQILHRHLWYAYAPACAWILRHIIPRWREDAECWFYRWSRPLLTLVHSSATSEWLTDAQTNVARTEVASY